MIHRTCRTKLRVRFGFDIESKANRISSAISIRFVIYCLNDYSNVKTPISKHFQNCILFIYFLNYCHVLSDSIFSYAQRRGKCLIKC